MPILSRGVEIKNENTSLRSDEMPLGSSIGWLVGLSENTGGQRFALDREEILIGRGTGCHIQLKDPKVSRKHARITIKAGQLTIEDLDSTQGVLINGERVDECQIQAGDRVQLGDTQLQVEFEQDSIETVMVPQADVPSVAGTCSQCGHPIHMGEKFCSQCGSSSVPLPPPFDFVQEAFLRLRALHRAGRMDSATYREELGKLVIQDGSGGFWMPGVESGEWFWFNGSEWIRRDPPLKPLVQAPLGDVAPTSPPPPPPSGAIEAEDDKKLGRLFLIGGGALIAFTILAVGAYAAYKLVNADDDESLAIAEVPPVSTIAIIQQSPTPEPTLMEALQPTIAPTWTQEPAASATPVLPYAIRLYNQATDEDLINLADITDFIDAISSPEHGIYEGSWEINRPGRFNIGWCAIDANTLYENLRVIEMSLEVDGTRVEPTDMLDEEFGDSTFYCRTSQIVVEFSEPGEYRLLWTTSYSEPIFDGWETLESGTYLNEYVLEIRDSISIVDEFDVGDGTWFETKQTNFDQWIEDGVFNILVHKENFFTWSLYNDLEVDDVFILTDVKRISGVEGAYGIVFRLQDVNNFYYFLVDDSGYFTLGKRLEGEWIPLIDWTVSDAILSGDAFNSLGVVINGDELVVYVNLELVGQVVDDTFANGGVGVAAQSIETTGEMHAIFDVFSLDYYQ
jgi:hypothetical protein